MVGESPSFHGRPRSPVQAKADGLKSIEFIERVAQSVEHLTFNQRVMGSSPIALTNKIK